MVVINRFFGLFLVMLLPLYSLANEVEITFTGKFLNRFSIENSWNTLLINRNNVAVMGYLHAEIKNVQGLPVLSADSRNIELKPGAPTNTMGLLQTQSFRFEQELYENLYRSAGALPPGNYNICLSFINQNGQTLGQLCEDISLFLISTPLPILPEDGKIINEPNKLERSVMFNWTPIVPSYSGNTFYQLCVFEVLDGQTPEEAVASNPVFFRSEETPLQQYYYNQMGPLALQPGHSYAWQVVARLKEAQPEQSTLELNVGSSEVRSFSLKKEDPRDTVKYVVLSDNPANAAVKLNEDGKLYFSFTTRYSLENIEFMVQNVSSGNIDKKAVVEKSDTVLFVPVVNYFGSNKYVTDLSKLNLKRGAYLLIVVLPGREKLYCRFSKN